MGTWEFFLELITLELQKESEIQIILNLIPSTHCTEQGKISPLPEPHLLEN
jgi:hypothetical protein